MKKMSFVFMVFILFSCTGEKENKNVETSTAFSTD